MLYPHRAVVLRRAFIGVAIGAAALALLQSHMAAARDLPAHLEPAVAMPPFAADRDNDGLPDDWETGPGRAYGCDPKHADLIVYAVQRTDLTAQVNATIQRAIEFYANLDVRNPDGTRGIHLFVIRGPKITGTDSYADLKGKYLPRNLLGRAHFHVFSTDPGGQTCEECQASISGVQSQGWQSFVHELGHQLGLTHEGRGFKVQSPMHASVMNYAYLATFNGSEDGIRYSDGQFASLKMKETDLDETVPFPAAALEFLTRAPYRFSIRPAGNRTEVDWNRNGVFGETHVRADINYAGGTYLGDRIDVDTSTTAPAGAYHGDTFYVAHGVAPQGRPRTVVLRKWLGDGKWGPRIATGLANTIGDPSFVVQSDLLWVASATTSGIAIVALRPRGDGATVDASLGAMLPDRPARLVTLAVLDGRLVLFARLATNGHVTYRVWNGSGSGWSDEADTGLVSKRAPAAVWNPIAHQAVIVTIRDGNVPNRLIANVRGFVNGRLDEAGPMDWIGGARGGTATQARPAVLFDTTRDAGPDGRLYAYYMAGGAHDSAYFSMQIADRTFNDGWLERVAYDEWSTTASAPAAAISPKGDIAYCYRQEGDGMVKCAFHGSGVESGEMGDVDELAYIRAHGLRESIARDQKAPRPETR